MFIPLGDEPNPSGTPFITYALIAVNCLVYALVTLPLSVVKPDVGDPAVLEYVRVVADQLPPGVSVQELLRQISAYDLYVFQHGFRPAEPSLVALFSSMFLHGGWMHLAGNMLFLWIYGDNVEYRLGRAPYLLAYLGTGAAATLFHAFFANDSQLPLVGASGAISGVLGFYFVWFPRNRVRLWIALFPFMMNVVYAPARLVLGLYLFVDNVLPFLVTRGGGGVAHGAHIGGFLAGLAVAWGINRREVRTAPREYRGARDTGLTVESLPEMIRRLQDEGRHEDAAAAYFRVPADRSRRLMDPAHAIEMGNWLASHGHPEAALVVFQRHLRDFPRGPYTAEAHLGAGLVELRALNQPTAAYQHLVDVLDSDPTPDAAAAAREGLAAIAARQASRMRSR